MKIESCTQTELVQRYSGLNQFSHLELRAANNDTYIALSQDSILLGMARLETPPSNEYVAFVEVAPAKTHRGYGKILLNEVFSYSATHSRVLLLSEYTPDGLTHLSREIDRLKLRYPQVYIAHAQFC